VRAARCKNPLGHGTVPPGTQLSVAGSCGRTVPSAEQQGKWRISNIAHLACILSAQHGLPRLLLSLELHLASAVQREAEEAGSTEESQNGRGWKGPLWVTQSNPLPKQGHPEQAVQDLVQAGLEYLQRRRLHNLPGQPGPGLCHPQREEVLPCVQEGQEETARLTRQVEITHKPAGSRNWRLY